MLLLLVGVGNELLDVCHDVVVGPNTTEDTGHDRRQGARVDHGTLQAEKIARFYLKIS